MALATKNGEIRQENGRKITSKTRVVDGEGWSASSENLHGPRRRRPAANRRREGENRLSAAERAGQSRGAAEWVNRLELPRCFWAQFPKFEILSLTGGSHPISTHPTNAGPSGYRVHHAAALGKDATRKTRWPVFDGWCAALDGWDARISARRTGEESRACSLVIFPVY